MSKSGNGIPLLPPSSPQATHCTGRHATESETGARRGGSLGDSNQEGGIRLR